MSAAIGLDFGTSFVRMAVLSQGQPTVLCQPIPVWQGAGFPQPPGTDLQLKQKIHETAPLVIYGQAFSRFDLAVRVLTHCRRQAEATLGTAVDGCVTTVHSQAGSMQREMLRQALQKSGFNQIRLINTPAAVALDHYEAGRGEQKGIILCLGAGMLDLNVAVCTPASYTVLASGGLEHVSGKQFTARLSGLLLQQFQEQNQINLAKNASALELIWDEAELAKISLSTAEEAVIDLPRLVQTGEDTWLDFHAAVSRAQFEENIDSYLQDMLNLCQRYLTDLHLEPGDLNEIWLEGGTVRIPALQNALARWSGKPPALVAENAAALGAALHTRALAQPVAAAPVVPPPGVPPSEPPSHESVLEELARVPDADQIARLMVESDQRLQVGDYEGAVQQLTQAGILLQQKRARVFYLQGMEREKKNDLSSARSLYLVASRMDRTNPDYKEAIDRLNHQEARIAHNQGRELERAGEVRKAFDAYHLAVQLDPDNYGYRGSRARLSLRLLLPKRFEAFVSSRSISRERLNTIYRQIEKLYREVPTDRYLGAVLKAFRLISDALDLLQTHENGAGARKSSQERRQDQEDRRARAEILLREALILTPDDAFIKKLLDDYVRR